MSCRLFDMDGKKVERDQGFFSVSYPVSFGMKARKLLQVLFERSKRTSDSKIDTASLLLACAKDSKYKHTAGPIRREEKGFGC